MVSIQSGEDDDMYTQSTAKTWDGLSAGLHSVRVLTGLCVGHEAALVPLSLTFQNLGLDILANFGAMYT